MLPDLSVEGSETVQTRGIELPQVPRVNDGIEFEEGTFVIRGVLWKTNGRARRPSPRAPARGGRQALASRPPA
ncbi:hypothetical protein [Georgenia sp. AZ-5]|uniref:hypothetical protein n=1 Tax=Georgenia sp. AZ-5 TaxID=3367526 RepID=UPI0037545AB1